MPHESLPAPFGSMTSTVPLLHEATSHNGTVGHWVYPVEPVAPVPESVPDPALQPLLQLPRHLVPEGTSVWDTVTWETRDALIVDKDGHTVFAQNNVRFPSTWSQTAVNVVASKYFRLVNGQRETGVDQMIQRVSRTITEWGIADGYFDTATAAIFAAELQYLLLHQMSSFNSPVWFNIGVPGVEQAASACYILSVEDSMEGILEWYRQEGMIFSRGAGAGVNISSLRSKKESISKGGYSSGPMSFSRAADASAFSIKSGGATRRSARMLVMNADHPDIEDFIQAKSKEEAKARVLQAAGYDDSLDGEIYATVAHQNCNMSVSVTDAFLEAVEQDQLWELRYVTTGEVAQRVPARDLFRQMATATWQCGDPGIQYNDTMNRWHTCPQSGSIKATNPCSEYLFLNDTACNLSSLNLLTFLRDDDTFDTGLFRHAVDIMITAKEILVSRASYPTEAITRNSHRYRTLGIGYANLGALLMAQGLPYDSDAGRDYAASITSLMTGEAYAQSARLAQVQGPFEGYAANKEAMRAVIGQHDAARQTLQRSLIGNAARAVWQEALNLGARYGYRNAQVSLLAPTGTVSIMMDCFTGDTLVATADGRNAVTLKQLAEEKKDVDVYASQNGRTVIKRMHNICKVRSNVKIVRVNLDDGTYIRCTPDHNIMLRDGTYKRADELCENDSLMRFDSIVTKETGALRRKIWMGPKAGGDRLLGKSWKMQYRFIAGEIFEGYNGRSGGIVHHVNEDTLDDCPGNLALCANFSDHLRLHWAEKTPEERSLIMVARNAKLTPEQRKERARKTHEAQTPEERRARGRKAAEAHTPEERSEWTKEGWAKITPEQRSERSQKGWSGISQEERTARAHRIWEKRRSNKQVMNHKVLAVLDDGYEDVYCGEVEEVHNFAIITTKNEDKKYGDLSGVVVHNCATTGVEPDVALVNYKALVGGGTIKKVNEVVPRALNHLLYTDDQIRLAQAYIGSQGTLEGCSVIAERDLPVFDCAFPTTPGGRAIHYEGHIRMVAAVQPFLTGSASKTINLPHDATIEDIEAAYLLGWKLGCKSLAVYRDGCKATQVLTTQQQLPGAAIGSAPAPGAGPYRRRLPDERAALTHKATIAGHELYLTIGLYEDGTPGEIFLRMAKEGSTISGLMDAFATSISMALQYGVPLQALCDKFQHSRFEPAGFTPNPEIKIATSITDYIFRYLALKFLGSEEQTVALEQAIMGEIDAIDGTIHRNQVRSDVPLCSECGALCRITGNCAVCTSCGSSMGCS